MTSRDNALPPKVSATELVRAMRERNAPRRAEVLRRVASLRRIAEECARPPGSERRGPGASSADRREAARGIGQNAASGSRNQDDASPEHERRNAVARSVPMTTDT